MRRLASFALVGLALALPGCGGTGRIGGSAQTTAIKGPIRIHLDPAAPSRSSGTFTRGQQSTTFRVGFGRHGVTCAGSRFEEGYTPLGRFRVNAILTGDRFLMDPGLIARSGKTEAELRRTLFRNMNAIDFDGDGERGEYGIGYVSLEPLNSVSQPFTFNHYDGRFRWYSFAIHGSNNDQRIGQKVTGGCINVSGPDLRTLLGAVRLGDEVVVSANGPCTP